MTYQDTCSFSTAHTSKCTYINVCACVRLCWSSNTTILYKSINLLLCCLKGSKCWEREREKARYEDWRKTAIIDTIFLDSRYDSIFRAQLSTSRRSWSGPVLNAKPRIPRVILEVTSALNANFSWLTACSVGLVVCVLWHINLCCLFNA